MKNKHALLLSAISIALLAGNASAQSFCGNSSVMPSGTCVVVKTSGTQAISGLSLVKQSSFKAHMTSPAPTADDLSLVDTNETAKTFMQNVGVDSYDDDNHFALTHFSNTISAVYLNGKLTPVSHCTLDFDANTLNGLAGKQIGFTFSQDNSGNLSCKAETADNTICPSDFTIAKPAQELLGDLVDYTDLDVESGACVYSRNIAKHDIYNGDNTFTLAGKAVFGNITITANNPFQHFVFNGETQDDVTVETSATLTLQTKDGANVAGCQVDLSDAAKQKTLASKVVVLDVTDNQGTLSCKKSIVDAPTLESANDDSDTDSSSSTSKATMAMRYLK